MKQFSNIAIQQFSNLPTSIPPADMQSALLNILDDMQEDKKWLEKQRTAALNMMEDLMEQQEELKASRKQFQDLNTMLFVLSQKTSTKGALDFLTWSLRSIARFKKVAILTSNQFGNLKCTSGAGYPKDWPLDKFILSTQDKTDTIVRVYLEGKFIAIDNARGADVNISLEFVEMLTLTSFLLMPLSLGAGQKALVIADRGELLPFSRTEVDIFKTFTSQAGAVLTKINLVTILEAQKKKLEQLDKAKSEFLSTASHQLRTPLSTMRWSFETLLEDGLGPLTKEQKEHLKETYEANQRLIKIVNELLNVSRIEMDRVKQEPKLVKIEEIIEKAVAGQSLPAKGQKVSLNFKKPEALPQVFVDEERLREILENLISNAIRYNKPQGSVTVSVNKKNDFIQVEIADTGLGIPKAQQEKVFTKFFRGENVARKEKRGTGLGLYIAKSYVEAWGGKMWFESQEDKGTTFFFTVPVAKGNTKEQTTEERRD